MKTRTLLLSAFTLISSFVLLSQTRIPIQGIAREGNTAFIDQEILLTFELYFTNNNGATEVNIATATNQQITTDAYGVFSYELIVAESKNYAIANHKTFLRITTTSGATISDEILGEVPYAISAKNGVPTGAIMPFVGNTAPEGWLIANGDAIPAGADFDDLRAFFPSGNVPDLRAMFLRGSGTNGVYTGRSGPATNDNQLDENKSHTHNTGTISIAGGAHSHSYNEVTGQAFGNPGSSGGADNLQFIFINSRQTTSNGHSHTLSGNTGLQGSESRPINYGVTYIIKL